MTDRPDVRFLCMHNAGRTHMAAAPLDHVPGQAVVRSAGSAPANTINPAVVKVNSIGLLLNYRHRTAGENAPDRIQWICWKVARASGRP